MIVPTSTGAAPAAWTLQIRDRQDPTAAVKGSRITHYRAGPADRARVCPVLSATTPPTKGKMATEGDEE